MKNLVAVRRVLAAIVLAVAAPPASAQFGAEMMMTTSAKKAAGPATGGGFLARSGTQLILNGSPYHAVGFDANYLASFQNIGQTEIDTYFAALQPHSLTRIFTTDTGQYGNDSTLALLITEAAKYSQMLIVSLGDCQNNGNDMTGYNGQSPLPVSFFTGGYQTYYKPHVQHVVSQYVNSTVIGMWEVGNECSSPDQNLATNTSFYQTMTAYIKSLDNNHLVASGSMPDYAFGSFSNYKSIFNDPNLDVMDIHEYDYDYQCSHTIVSAWFTNDLPAAQQNNKTFMIGETGINPGACGTSLATRASAFQAKFDGYLKNPGGGAVVLLWSYVPASILDAGYDIGPSDPTTAMVGSYPLP